MKKYSVLLITAFISGCGGGGGDDTDESSTDTTGSIFPDICSGQSEYFESLSGIRVGMLSELELGSISLCEFEVTMEIDNAPNPAMNCSTSGTVSYTGTQLIVDDVTPSICQSAIDLPITVGQSVPFVTNPAEIPLPTTLTLIVDGVPTGTDENGMVLRNPFIGSQVVTLDPTFSILVGGTGVLSPVTQTKRNK